MASYGTSALGALTGAGSGALLGSSFGPIGTGIGAGIGGLAGGLTGLFKPEALTGYESKTEQLPRFTPEQQSAMQQLLQRGLKDYNPEANEKRARTQFQSQTIPSIAERFTSMGSGAQNSSAFQGSLGSAGAGLEEALSALRSQYGQFGIQQGLQPSFENIYTPASQGFFGGAAPGFGQALGKGLAGQIGDENGGIAQLIKYLQSLGGSQGQNQLGGA